jgi:hypothetical protein
MSVSASVVAATGDVTTSVPRLASAAATASEMVSSLREGARKTYAACVYYDIIYIIYIYIYMVMLHMFIMI